MNEHEAETPDVEDTKPGPFGGLSASEARQRRTDKERLEKELAASDPKQRIINALIEQAIKGNPQAVRELRELNVLTPETPESKGDRGLLGMLTVEQRACVAAHLKGEKVPRELALRAWT